MKLPHGGRVTWRSGSEGPRHDPYHFEELHWTHRDRSVKLHMGLVTWIHVKDNRYDAGMKVLDPELCAQHFKTFTGYEVGELVSMQFAHTDEYDELGDLSRYE